jgi:4-alpha-glucanotransferase
LLALPGELLQCAEAFGRRARQSAVKVAPVSQTATSHSASPYQLLKRRFSEMAGLL